MATKITWKNNIDVKSMINVGVLRTHKIIVNANGRIGKNNIDLGRQGDHNVTALVFNLDKLEENINLNEYNASCIFYNEDYPRDNTNPITVDFDGHLLLIPNEITKRAGRYRIIFALQEIKEDTDDIEVGNIEFRETFVSSEFTGIVMNSCYEKLKNGFDELTPSLDSLEIVNTSQFSVIKPKILIRGTKTISTNKKSFGNKLDSYVTYIDPTGITVNTESKAAISECYMLVVKNEDYDNIQKYYLSTENKYWIPKAWTEEQNSYELIFVAKGDLNKNSRFEYITNTLSFTVEDNYLISDDFAFDYSPIGFVVLRDENDISILDENGVTIVARGGSN